MALPLPMSRHGSLPSSATMCAREAGEPHISLTDWLQSNRLLRRFFLRFSDPSWVEVAKNLCILGVLSLQHLAPENAWSTEDLAELVEHLQRVGWPQVPGQSQEWLPPWQRKRKVFPKPSGDWRSGSSEPLHRVLERADMVRKPSSPSSSQRRVPDRELLRRSSADKEVPVPSAPADARCTFCDHHLVPDARFCPKCGHLRSPRSPEVRQAWPEASWTVRTRRLERGTTQPQQCSGLAQRSFEDFSTRTDDERPD
ncbi:unnamed protein product [Durusdinium trenchii]|uniref:Zinc ribbon domain-containing protein n=1 Tax=Durusdinium trenchii TaxID=1381693 RepID=A0ABP0PSW2_9DINO